MLKCFGVIRHLTKCSKENSHIVSNAISNSTKKLHLGLNNNDKTKTIDKKIIQKYNEEDEDYEEMFVNTQFNNIEWGGPLRGGKHLEPTRFGDWERKGRCTDY